MNETILTPKFSQTMVHCMHCTSTHTVHTRSSVQVKNGFLEQKKCNLGKAKRMETSCQHPMQCIYGSLIHTYSVLVRTFYTRTCKLIFLCSHSHLLVKENVSQWTKCTFWLTLISFFINSESEQTTVQILATLSNKGCLLHTRTCTSTCVYFCFLHYVKFNKVAIWRGVPLTTIQYTITCSIWLDMLQKCL